MYNGEKVSFLYPHTEGSIEEALYELCNSKSEDYEKEWYDILLKRISSSSPSNIQRRTEWISINDKKPDEYQRIVSYTPNYMPPEKRENWDSERSSRYITHWMPIPKEPLQCAGMSDR